ncbi:hypothetical protein Vretimale_1837 [Volvox reticuliferus]|nr:hypothetical protein Vretimale_1837 [Volvox reticuliferus]
MSCTCQFSVSDASKRVASLPPSSFATRVFTGLSLAGGLLSSSCCIIQLALNLMNLGCAGFAVLTPWKTQFRTFTFVALAHLIYRDKLNRRSLLTIALTIALMFSQDAVRLHNLYTGLPSPTAAEPNGRYDQPPGKVEAPLPESDDATQTSASYTKTSSSPTQPQPEAYNCSDSLSSSSSSSSSNCRAARSGPIPSCDTRTPDQDATGHNRLGRTTSNATTAAAASRDAVKSRSAWKSGIGVTGSDADGGGATAASDGFASVGKAGTYFRFQVDGIKCEGCAARLKAALLRMAGVQRCAVDFASGQVLVWGAPGAALEAGEVRGVIQFVDLSYRAVLVESSWI